MRKIFLNIIILFGVFIFLHTQSYVHAAVPYEASDVLGQPDFTSYVYGDGTEGFSTPYGNAIDTTHHKLYVADQTNCRVQVFNLNSDNNLLDHAADFALGAADPSSNGYCAITQNSFTTPVGLAVDEVNNRLFVGDYSRVLVFNFDSGIVNGMNASYVLGQPDFTSDDCNSGQNGICYIGYNGLTYDSFGKKLFVIDSSRRIMVFDVDPLYISNYEDADYVLGQPDFDSNCGVVTQNCFDELGENGMVYDQTDNWLFVSNSAGNRVLVFDLSNGISNGMNASYVLGQADFTSSNTGLTQNAFSLMYQGLAYDEGNKQLFVDDSYGNNRILVFDLSHGITNGMNAAAVIGAPDFITAGDGGTTQSTFYYTYSANNAFDTTNNRLYFSDADSNTRILIFNFVKLPASLATPTLSRSYTYSSAAIQSQGTVTYSLTSGVLPDGLSLNTSTGEISGTPSKWGTYTFTLKAIDDNGAIGYFFDTQTYTLTVGNEPSRPEGQISTTDTPICMYTSPLYAPNLFHIQRTGKDAVLHFTPIPSNTSYYFISYGTDTTAEGYSLEIPQPIDTTGAISQDIHMLNSNKTYYFKVRAGNNCMPGPWSSVVK